MSEETTTATAEFKELFRAALKKHSDKMGLINEYVQAISGGIPHLEAYLRSDDISPTERATTAKAIHTALTALDNGDPNWADLFTKATKKKSTKKAATTTPPSTPAVAETEPDPDDEEAQAMKLLMAARERKKAEAEKAAQMKLEAEKAAQKAALESASAKETMLKVKDEVDEKMNKLAEHMQSSVQMVEKAIEGIYAKIDAKIKASGPAATKSEIEAAVNAAMAKPIEDALKGIVTATLTQPEDAEIAPEGETTEARSAKAVSIGLYHPKKDPTYHMDNDLRKLMEHINNARKVSPENVSMVGPQGTGKTEFGIQFAAEYGLPCLIMDAANIREPRDWFGHRDYDGKRLVWRRSLFDVAVSAGNCVIILDELPRANSSVLNALFPILDARRCSWIEEKNDVIRVGPGTVFIATMNEGAQFTGNNTLDAALSDRFTRRVEVNYLRPGDESKVLIERTGVNADIANKLCDLAATVRAKATGFGATLTKTISTRQLIAAAKEFKELGPTGLRYCLSNHYSSEGGEQSERAQVLQMIQLKFGTV